MDDTRRTGPVSRACSFPADIADVMGTGPERSCTTHGSEVLIFSITPPRRDTPPDKLAHTAAATLERLRKLPVDALALYDIVEEVRRNGQVRPYPFQESLDPGDYLVNYLMDWSAPAVVYRCVGKYSADELSGWLTSASNNVATVFVGASSADEPVHTTLADAHALKARVRPEMPLGGVAIPERHRRRGDEDARLVAKQAAGCGFFITQIVYDLSATKDLASDYAYRCDGEGIGPAPLIFTLSLCGSLKTLEFLEWLGVDVPRWLRNELVHANDPLGVSLDHSLDAARELAEFCRHLGLPFGFNVESVSNRRVEIEAAAELTRLVADEVLSRQTVQDAESASAQARPAAVNPGMPATAENLRD